jgi:hypothetical protein
MRMNIGMIAAVISVAVASFSSVGCASLADGGGRGRAMTPLFDGRTLDGWAFLGDPSAWGVVDGEIRVVQPGRFGWIRSEKMYRDFELEAEFYLEEGTNSGLGLRCAGDGDPAFTGMELQIYDSHGDDPAKNGCGAVYNAIPPRLQAVHPPGEWNAYRVRLVGDELTAWLNGEMIHNRAPLDDRGIVHRPEDPAPLNERLTTGYIAFQAHGEPGLRLRNIRIRDLSPDPDPGDLEPALVSNPAGPAINGAIAGWTPRGGGEWLLEGTTLTGKDGPGHLFSDAVHSDIELRMSVRVNERGNSGVYFRTVPRPEDPDTWPLGYEAQVDNHDPKNFTGVLYDRAWAEGVDAPMTRDGAWFDYRIVAAGDRIRTWINGEPMVDTTLDLFGRGHVAFQTHHEGNVIEYRDVRWRVPHDGDGGDE